MNKSISVFRAIHEGLERVQKPCSILAKVFTLLLLAIFVGIFGKIVMAFLLPVFLPAYLLLGLIIKLFLMRHYMFWAVKRVNDIHSWIEDASIYMIIWRPDSFLGRVALIGRRKEFKKMIQQREMQLSLEFDKAKISEQNHGNSREKYSSKKIPLYSYKKDYLTEIYYSYNTFNYYYIAFLLIVFITLGVLSFLYAEYILLNIIILVSFIPLAWHIYLFKRFNKNKGVQIRIDKKGIYFASLEKSRSKNPAKRKVFTKHYLWEEINNIEISYNETIVFRRGPNHYMSYWGRSLSSHYTLDINYSWVNHINYLTISAVELDELISVIKNK